MNWAMGLLELSWKPAWEAVAGSIACPFAGRPAADHAFGWRVYPASD